MKALALLAVVLAFPAMAGEKSPEFYKRTGTKPPITGEFVIGPSLHYSAQVSPGLTFGYRWNNGIQFLADASVLRLDAQDGSAPYQVGCRTLYADWTTGSHTTGQVGVSVLFPLKALARPAK